MCIHITYKYFLCLNQPLKSSMCTQTFYRSTCHTHNIISFVLFVKIHTKKRRFLWSKFSFSNFYPVLLSLRSFTTYAEISNQTALPLHCTIQLIRRQDLINVHCKHWNISWLRFHLSRFLMLRHLKRYFTISRIFRLNTKQLLNKVKC